MKEVQCQVQSISSLTEHVYKVILKPEHPVSFQPGQYLNFVMAEQDKRPFSIANAPTDDFIELQIGAFAADSYPMQVIERIKESKIVSIEIPLGNAEFRRDSQRPILLIAGGTGFSYIKSILEYLSFHKSDREVLVYWGLRDPSACFELAKTAETMNTLTKGVFHAVVETPDDDWKGRVGMVHKIVMSDIDNLAEYDIYLAGRFDMVAAVRDDFVAKGAKIDRMFADAFAYI